jgi:hypothetical protein
MKGNIQRAISCHDMKWLFDQIQISNRRFYRRTMIIVEYPGSYKLSLVRGKHHVNTPDPEVNELRKELEY